MSGYMGLIDNTITTFSKNIIDHCFPDIYEMIGSDKSGSRVLEAVLLLMK